MKPIIRLLIVTSCLTTIVVLSRCGGGSQSSTTPLTITPASLPNGTVETLYSQQVQAGGGVGPFHWSVSGALPHNLTLSNGTTNTVMLLGTPDTAVQAAAFTIKVTDSANHSTTQAYTISILREPDTLSLAPPSLSFAPQLMGTASGAQIEIVSNTGSSAVLISSITLTGNNAGDYGQSNNCGSSLAPAANCAINVTVTPSQVGPSSAAITITDSTVGSPHSVALTGVGLTQGANATLSASSLTFGNQIVGTLSPAQSITMSNYGTATLNIAGIAVTANFSETDTCSGSILGSGASCAIKVTFTPSVTSSVTGTLSVTDSAPGSPQMVSLSGMGVTSNYLLTGNCFHGNPATAVCTQTPDVAQCPAGQRAITPSFASCYFPHSTSVDTSARCSVKGHPGYCATVFTGGAGSGADFGGTNK